MMKTFEAMLTGVLIITTLALLSLPALRSESQYVEVKKACERMLLSLSDEEEFRNLVVAVDDESSLTSVKEYIDPYLDWPFELEICDESECWGKKPNVQNYVTIIYMLDGNLTNYRIMKIKLYVWLLSHAHR